MFASLSRRTGQEKTIWKTNVHSLHVKDFFPVGSGKGYMLAAAQKKTEKENVINLPTEEYL